MYNAVPNSDSAFLRADSLDDSRALSPSELKLLTCGSFTSLPSHDSSPTKSCALDSISCCSELEALRAPSRGDDREHSTSLPDLNHIDIAAAKTWSCAHCKDLLDSESCAECRDHLPLDRRKSNPENSRMLKNPIELTLSVKPGDNRLSKVLESIPLVYIPHTKQLISANQSASIPIPISNQHPPHQPCESSPSNRETAQANEKCVSEAHTDHIDQSLSNITNLDTKSKSDSDTSSITIAHDEIKTLETPKIVEEALDPVFDLDLDSVDHIENPRNAIPWPSAAHRTDASSFSSLSSISTDYSLSTLGDEFLDLKAIPLDGEDTGFMEINLHSRNTFEKSSTLSSQDSGIEDRCSSGVKPKRRGISYLARTLFSKKPKDGGKIAEESSQSAPGWKLFGKVPPKHVPHKDPDRIQEEYQIQQLEKCSLASSPSPSLSRKHDIEVASTTGLILEDRPTNLPPKSAAESELHKQQYEAMMEAARRKELKEAKKRRRQLQHQLKLEDQLAAALKVWNSDILPSWENSSHTKKARDLWWLGIPPSVRGKVWKLAIGNELNITPELYEICLNRARERLKTMDKNGESQCHEESSNKESSVEVIRLDVFRTFPQLGIFQKGGPYNELLHSLLGAYACYRPDVGYVQGMSFVAAVLLLNMDVDDAFISFANLLNKPCQVAFFRINENLMKSYFLTYEQFFHENLPKLCSHFKRQNLTPDLYIIDWMYTLFSRSLPLDVASRVWDVFCRDGEEFLFRTALGILKLFEEILYNLDFIHLAQFLTKLPETISADQLFRAMENIKMTIDKKRFNQVLVTVRDSLDTT